MPSNAKVKSIVEGRVWKWPPTVTIQLLELQRHTPIGFLPNADVKDTIVWSSARDGKFSIISTWDEWRVHYPRVYWNKLLWFPAHIPRVSVVLWLAFRNRLNTRDKMFRYGISQDPSCGLCQGGIETSDHLFFECPFSYRVWTLIRNKCCVSWADRTWNEWVDLCSKDLRGNRLGTYIRKLFFWVSSVIK